MFKKKYFLLLCIFFVFLVHCSNKQTKQLYNFPILSQGQLIDLKKISESLEGFFMSTDLSDFDSSWSKRGFYLYVCIRFLNDKKVNTILKNTALPLLIQVSNHKDKPEAESILLLHPKSITNSNTKKIYYKEQKQFTFTNSSMLIYKKAFNIFDTDFNESGKITRLSFLKKDSSIQQLEEVLYQAELNNNYRFANSEGLKNEIKTKDIYLEVSAFAKLFSSSCDKWPMLKYTHREQIPDYLQLPYSTKSSDKPHISMHNDSKTSNNPKTFTPPDPDLTLIPIDAPLNLQDN